MATPKTAELINKGMNPNDLKGTLQEGESRPMMPDNPDFSMVLPQEIKEYKADPDKYALRWLRDPHYWEQDEKDNRVRQFKHQYPGAEVCKESDGSEVRNGDLVLMKYPKEYKDYQQALIDANSEVQKNPDEYVEQNAAEALQGSRELKIFQERLSRNSPTYKVDYMNAVESKTKDEISEEEEFHRTKGRLPRIAEVGENIKNNRRTFLIQNNPLAAKKG